MTSLRFGIVLTFALLSNSYGQSRPAFAPIPARGVPPDVKSSSLPPADVLLAEGKARSRQADFIAMERFRKDSTMAIQLGHELADVAKQSIDARVEKMINKKGRELDRALVRMINWLDDSKPAAEKSKVQAKESVTESIQTIVRLLDAVTPQLTKVVETQSTTLDIELTRDVTDQLIAIQRVTRGFS